MTEESYDKFLNAEDAWASSVFKWTSSIQMNAVTWLDT